MLVWLLDKPEPGLDENALACAGPDGHEAVLGALRELEDAGYLEAAGAA
jgi:hypothetical protein